MNVKYFLFIALCICVPVLSFIPTHESGRQPSFPFITGDTFRFIADYKMDEAARIDPTAVHDGDIIFVSPNYIQQFFNDIEPRIDAQFIMITHNGDYSLPGKYRDYLDNEKLIAWFAVNADAPDHPKAHAIPIGIANRYWAHKGHCHGNVESFELMKQENTFFNVDKKNEVYVNFEIGTNTIERNKAYNHLKNKDFTFLARPKQHRKYLQEMSKYRFVASPLGNGIDCHRTWEALIVGCIPIVQSSSINEIYEGLPVIIIDDWAQVTREFLDDKYEELKQHSFFEERKYMDYWVDKVRSIN